MPSPLHVKISKLRLGLWEAWDYEWNNAYKISIGGSEHEPVWGDQDAKNSHLGTHPETLAFRYLGSRSP